VCPDNQRLDNRHSPSVTPASPRHKHPVANADWIANVQGRLACRPGYITGLRCYRGERAYSTTGEAVVVRSLPGLGTILGACRSRTFRSTCGRRARQPGVDVSSSGRYATVPATPPGPFPCRRRRQRPSPAEFGGSTTTGVVRVDDELLDRLDRRLIHLFRQQMHETRWRG
jgi:hypothetical protein